jgi:hypothetical protein
MRHRQRDWWLNSVLNSVLDAKNVLRADGREYIDDRLGENRPLHVALAKMAE